MKENGTDKINAVVRFSYIAYIDVHLNNMPSNLSDRDLIEKARKTALIADTNEFSIRDENRVEDIKKFKVDENGNEKEYYGDNDNDREDEGMHDEGVNNIIERAMINIGHIERWNNDGRPILVEANVGDLDVAQNNN